MRRPEIKHHFDGCLEALTSKLEGQNLGEVNDDDYDQLQAVQKVGTGYDPTYEGLIDFECPVEGCAAVHIVSSLSGKLAVMGTNIRIYEQRCMK